jgi:hypothetical protein
MDQPDNYGLPSGPLTDMFPPVRDRTMEMLKTAFCLVLASWMTACIMIIIYSREIAEFMVERMQ